MRTAQQIARDVAARQARVNALLGEPAPGFVSGGNAVKVLLPTPETRLAIKARVCRSIKAGATDEERWLAEQLACSDAYSAAIQRMGAGRPMKSPATSDLGIKARERQARVRQLLG